MEASMHVEGDNFLPILRDNLETVRAS